MAFPCLLLPILPSSHGPVKLILTKYPHVCDSYLYDYLGLVNTNADITPGIISPYTCYHCTELRVADTWQRRSPVLFNLFFISHKN
jgi:hypothetical protein